MANISPTPASGPSREIKPGKPAPPPQKQAASPNGREPARPIDQAQLSPGSQKTSVHPGTILFVDKDTGKEEKVPYQQVPETVAFVEQKGVKYPVSRIETHNTRNKEFVIRSFGTEGQFLESTTMRDP